MTNKTTLLEGIEVEPELEAEIGVAVTPLFLKETGAALPEFGADEDEFEFDTLTPFTVEKAVGSRTPATESFKMNLARGEYLETSNS